MLNDPTRTGLTDRLLTGVTQADSARTPAAVCRSLLCVIEQGAPAAAARLAAAAGQWPRKHRGIVGWGLSLNPTPHQCIVEAKLRYTWCTIALFDGSVVTERDVLPASASQLL